MDILLVVALFAFLLGFFIGFAHVKINHYSTEMDKSIQKYREFQNSRN